MPAVCPGHEGRSKSAASIAAWSKHVHETLDNLKQHFPDYDEKAGYEIAGFVWFQGYNDMFDETARQGLWQKPGLPDQRPAKEFKAPEMKVVVGVMGVNGARNEGSWASNGTSARAARSMNTMPEFKGNVKAIESAPLLHPDVVALKTAGWLSKERDLKKNPITADEKAMLARATSNGLPLFRRGPLLHPARQGIRRHDAGVHGQGRQGGAAEAERLRPAQRRPGGEMSRSVIGHW